MATAAVTRDGAIRVAEFRPADDDHALAAALAGAVDDHGLRRCSAVGVLAGGDYQIQQLQAPEVPAEELPQALRWRLRDVISEPLEQVVSDVIPIPAGSTRRGPPMVYAVAAQRERTEHLAGAIADSGLHVAALDIPELAIRNLAARVEPQGGGVAVLAVGEQDGLLTISREGALYLVRALDLGATHLRADPDQVAGRLALEVQRSLDYYDSQLYGAPPRSILVLPTAEVDSADLAARMASELGVDVAPMDVAALLPDSEPLSDGQQRRVALAVGAALRGVDGG